jgi:hypothetical protein
MAAGLAPGQVRPGLRMLGAVLEVMDDFCRLLGQEFTASWTPLYRSAILYERRRCRILLRARAHGGHPSALPARG